jgi:MYXO-CTERM domain-containing protein
MDIAQAQDWMSAVAWLNTIPMDASAAQMDDWADFIVCRYNGCCTTSTTCTTRRAGYRDNAIDAFDEMGASFWDESQRCTAIPDDGIIDQRSNCYVAGGDPRYWRRVDSGYADTSEWTGTTAAAAPANFGRWLVKATRATRYSVEVYLDGGTNGTSQTAQYKIVHAGTTETITVDQTSASGFVSLGEFDFAATGDEYIELGDNTGEPGSMDKQVMMDAVRVLPLDGMPPDDGGGGGCCETTGNGGRGNLLALGLVALVLRRRRRRSP